MRHPVRSSLRRRFAMIAPISRFAREDAGNLSIELGLLAPVMILFIFAIAEGGHLLWTVNALHYSVQEAARCASVNRTTCGSTTQIQSFAAGRSGAGFPSSAFTATVVSCGNRVSASYTMPLNIPFMPNSISLSAQSCYPI